MITKPSLFLIAALFSSLWIHAQNFKISSPDKKIEVKINHSDRGILYSIQYGKSSILKPSQLGFIFGEKGTTQTDWIFNKPAHKHVSDGYSLLVGKASQVKEDYEELSIPIEERNNLHKKIILRFRVFNDGVAFRYEWPKQEHWDAFSILEENTEFRLAGNPKVLTLFRENYTTSHEGIYDHLPLKDIKADTLMDLPTLFEMGNSIFLSITEADLEDFAGMYLIKHNGVLKSALSPLPSGMGIKVKAAIPHLSPWRVLMISNRVGGLIESNILTNLNPPSPLQDLSWIKPGKTTFPWWNGNVTPDTNFAPGNNFETNKYYIDFCAQVGFQYHSVVEYGLHEWYRSDGINFQPGPHTDATLPVPGLDIQQITDYAATKGVGIRFWVHWKALYPILDKALDQYEKWGIKGMMVDFMDRDDQEMVNIQNEIVEKAAKHKLHIQFHGAYKPTGRQRTFPNEFTREGTLNYENNKWGDRVGPDQDINIPFTRMLAGPTDYHLGGFRAALPSKFKAQYTAPLMLGTRCHMLAMYVVLENPQGMVCDYPAAYIGQPGFEFIQKVPTIWDETKVVDAEVGQYIILARKKGSEWYLGVITNHQSRTVKIPLSFLGEGSFKAEIFADAQDINLDPNRIQKTVQWVNSSQTLQLVLGAGGGGAIRFFPF